MSRIAVAAMVIALGPLAAAQCPGWADVFDTAGEGIAGLVTSMATFDDGHGAALYAAGRFTSAGSSGAVNLARWDGAHWNALQPAPVFSSSLDLIIALVVVDEPTGPALYVCGDFTMSGVGTPAMHSVARYDSTGWHSTSFGSWVDAATSWDDGSAPKLYTVNASSIGFQDVNRYLGNGAWGGLQEIHSDNIVSMVGADLGGGPRLFLASQYGITVCDSIGPVGTIVPPVYPVGVRTLFAYDDGNGTALFAGGRFVTGSTAVPFVARFDGSSWSDVGGAMSATTGYGDVFALCVHDFGNGPRLVAGGSFDALGGTPAHGIAVLEGNTWTALGAGIGPWSGYPWMAFASFDESVGAGPALFLSGGFTQAGGNPSEHIARYSSCGGPASLFCFGDGSATACPCGNSSAIGDRAGCLNSTGVGGTLRISGQASLANDTLHLEGGGMPNSSALYFQAGNLAVGGAGFAFGDSVKCTAGPFVRLRTKANVNGASSYPEAGDVPISVRGAITSPGTRHYQVHYRNAASFCTPATFNQTNGATVQWTP